MHLKKILVIGAHGQVGTSFQRVLTTTFKDSYDAWYTARKSEEIAPDSNIAGDRISSCDLASPQEISEIIHRIKPDIILNCAAYTAVDKAEIERDAAKQINAVAPGIMATEAKKIDALFVHYSTDYVFDGGGEAPWTEESQTNPINYYGETKLAGENAVRQSGCRHFIIRTQWVYSDHGHNFMKTMLRFGAQRPQLKVVGDQIGAPTSSDVIASTTMELIRSIDTHKTDYGIYNLACSGYTSWHEFAEKIFAEARTLKIPLAVEEVLKIPTHEFPTPAKRPFNSRLNLNKIEHKLGHSMPLWTEALRSTIALFSRNQRQ